MSKLGLFTGVWALASLFLERSAVADEQEAHALPALPVLEPSGSATDEPLPPATAPEAGKHVPPSAVRVSRDDWRFTLGVRVSDMGGSAFDYFASNDTLAQVSLEGSYTWFRRGRFTASAGAGYEVGARSSGARGLRTRLAVHRLTVPIEAGYHVTEWFRLFAKVAPGVAILAARVEDPSAKAPLDYSSWLLAGDASLGASVRLVNTPRARVWFTQEFGYGITSNRELRVASERTETDVLGVDQSAGLGSIALNGLFLKAGLAVTF